MDSKFVSDWVNEYYKTSTLKLKPLYYNNHNNNNHNNNKFEKTYENKSSISLEDKSIAVAKILLSLKSNIN